MGELACARVQVPLFELQRAGLFRDREELRKARTLIEECGYGRRKEELKDAERVIGG